MGWWSITSKNGGLSMSKADTGLYNGDGPADILGVAVDAIIKEYESAWGRKPYRQELEAALAFVVNPLELSDQKGFFDLKEPDAL